MNAGRDSLDLPLAGMTCAACAARIEKQLNKLPGVEAAVNFAAERVAIHYDAAQTTSAQLVETIRKTGFEVPPRTVELSLGGMTCASCAARIEKQLNKLPGVEAVVNLAAEKAHVRYVPGLADVAGLIAVVVKTGFAASVSNQDTHAEEKARKLAVYRAELRRFWISAALTLPLVGQMFFMFGGDWNARRRAAALAATAAGDPRATVDRLAFLRRRLQRPARRQRQYGRAGGAGHQHGLGLQCRGDGLRPAPACLFRGLGDGHHPRADGQDPRSPRQGEDLGGHRGAGEIAAADGAGGARRSAGRGAGGCHDSR
jgi:copper ion binding protein